MYRPLIKLKRPIYDFFWENKLPIRWNIFFSNCKKNRYWPNTQPYINKIIWYKGRITKMLKHQTAHVASIPNHLTIQRLVYMTVKPVHANTSRMINTCHPLFTFHRFFSFSIQFIERPRIGWWRVVTCFWFFGKTTQGTYSYKNGRCSRPISSGSSDKNSSQNGSLGRAARQRIDSFLTGWTKNNRRACRLMLPSLLARA